MCHKLVALVFDKLDVGVLFIKVVVKSVNFVFVNGGKSVGNVA